MSYSINGRCVACGAAVRSDGSCEGKCSAASMPISVSSGVVRSLDERAVVALERIADALARLVPIKVSGLTLIDLLAKVKRDASHAGIDV